MSVVIRTIQLLTFPTTQGEFTIPLIQGTIILAENSERASEFLALVPNGVVTTETRAFVFVGPNELVTDEDITKLKPVCYSSDGSRFLFERIMS